MDDRQTPGVRRNLFERKSTRRALLASGATVAAAGAAAAVIGVSARSGDHPAVLPGLASDGTGAAPESASAALDKLITDPRRRAAHLLRRAAFGGTAAQISEFAALSREDAADRLLNFETIDNSALDAKLAAANYDLIRPIDGIRWWYARMIHTARPLEERMTLIWHGLLTSQTSKIGGQRFNLMMVQNALFRGHALGNYDVLLQAVAKDPAMLVYLDTIDSTKDHPNENFARELLELYSMGVGNYTEDDVRESARAFTGWRRTMARAPQRKPGAALTPEELRKIQEDTARTFVSTFVLQDRIHDFGSKTFLGKTGPFGGEEIISIILEQAATGRFITNRLFSEFAHSQPSQQTSDRLVAVWDSSGHNIKAVVRAILVSDEFYSERSYRAIVRSPINFVVNAIRGLENADDLRPNMFSDRTIKGMDQTLFEPPNVAGWPGGAMWLSSSTFFARVNFLDLFLMGQRARSQRLPALEGAGSTEALVDRALAIFVDGNIPETSRQSIIGYANTVPNEQQRAAAVAYLVLASPEYQLV